MNAKNIHLVLCAVCVPCLPSLAIPELPRWTHGFEVVCWHAKAAAVALQESRKHYSIILRRTSQKVDLCLEPQSGLKDIGLLKKIIQGIPRYSNAILKWTEKGRIKSNKGGSFLWGWLRNPQVILVFIWTIVLPAFLIWVVSSVHRLISLIRKRRTRVFISFQHEREPTANVLVNELTKYGIRAEKLPFVESADSDTLLDQVKQQIRDCDIFICVPGDRPSFVEHEVSMAFIIEKPMFFVLHEADSQHLPNTAKKGYPIFALEHFQRKGFLTLANFCSYLAGDSRSTAGLYKAVFEHLGHCGLLLVAAFCISLLIVAGVGHNSGLLLGSSKTLVRNPVNLWSFVSNPANLWFFAPAVIVFLIPYSLFFITRLSLRAQLRRVIAGRKFRDTFIPKTLAYRLTGANLRKILYHGEILAHHESDTLTAKTARTA